MIFPIRYLLSYTRNLIYAICYSLPDTFVCLICYSCQLYPSPTHQVWDPLDNVVDAGVLLHQCVKTLLEILVKKAVHDWVGADRTHRWEMTASKHQQHHFGVLLVVLEGLENIDDNVKDIERGPGHEEDDADGDQHPVGFLPSLHLPSSPVWREVLTCLESQRKANPRIEILLLAQAVGVPVGRHSRGWLAWQ